MKKSVLSVTLMLLMMAGMLFTTSCAKKTIHSDATSSGEKALTQEEIAAREAAKKAEEMAKQQKAIEEQRLKDEVMRKQQTAEEEAAKAQFENKDIPFDYDSSELTPMARMILKEKAEWLSTHTYAAVTIEGHCDERGTTEYNLALGEKRALAAKRYLQDLGVTGNRMATISYGEEKPLVEGNDEASWAKNRRAHFVIR